MFGSPIPFGQPSNTTPFGFQTQQPLFGQPSTNNPFGSQTQSPFGQPSTNTPFGSPFGQPSNNSPFGSQTQSPFGQTNNANPNPFGTSLFGNNSTGVFGPQTQASSPFGATSSAGLFANTTQQSQFGSNGFATSTPFGPSTTNNMFGSRSAFSASSNSAFGPSSTSAFSASSTSAFGPSSTSSFNFGSSPAFAQTTSAFASSTPSLFAQGPSTGSRVTSYVPITVEETVDNKTKYVTLSSISGMNVYKDKSHEELKFEDYQKGDKGGPLSTGFNVTNSQPSTMFGQPQPSTNPANPFANLTATNLFSQTPANSNFGQSTSSTTTNPFGPSLFGPSTSSTNTNAFAPSTNPGFPSFQSTTTNLFSSSGSSFTTNPSSSNPPTFPSFPSTTTNPFASSGSSFASSSNPAFPSFPSNTTNLFASSGSSFASSSNPAFPSFPSSGSSFTTTPSQSLFTLPSTSFASSSSNAFSFPTPAFSSASTNVSTPGFNTGFNFNNNQTPSLFSSNPSTGQNTTPGFSFPTASTGMASLFSTTSSSTTTTTPFNQTPPVWPTLNFSQQQPQQAPASTNSVVMQQPTIVTNPFGTLPALPQISFDQGRNSSSFQYGISSRPVVDTPAPIRVSPLLTSRNILQRRVRAPLRKYRPGDDSAPKVPFFGDEDYSKSFHYLIPRENPRALLIRPLEKENLAPAKEIVKSMNGETNHQSKSDGEIGETPLVKADEKHEDHKVSSPSNAEILSLMPKLHHAEYYTEPRIHELAAKEREDPGYCGRVKDFVVGRNGYGNIKFLGETDVRRLELETLVQFNNREVLVYMDESTKHPVGEGLNKPAEVTLLNIKCYEKKSGKQVKEGSRLDKYKELLKRKGQEQGAEFVSYEAVNGEWKFRVQHF